MNKKRALPTRRKPQPIRGQGDQWRLASRPITHTAVNPKSPTKYCRLFIALGNGGRGVAKFYNARFRDKVPVGAPLCWICPNLKNRGAYSVRCRIKEAFNPFMASTSLIAQAYVCYPHPNILLTYQWHSNNIQAIRHKHCHRMQTQIYLCSTSDECTSCNNIIIVHNTPQKNKQRQPMLTCGSCSLSLQLIVSIHYTAPISKSAFTGISDNEVFQSVIHK